MSASQALKVIYLLAFSMVIGCIYIHIAAMRQSPSGRIANRAERDFPTFWYLVCVFLWAVFPLIDLVILIGKSFINIIFRPLLGLSVDGCLSVVKFFRPHPLSRSAR